MKRLPKSYVIFRVVAERLDEPCETKIEALKVSFDLDCAVYREQYVRNYSKGKWIGVSLKNKMRLKNWNKL